MDNILDYKFLNAYKELDIFCGDVFNCHNGVNEYISQMEMIPHNVRRLVPSFEIDYKMLKRCRYLRNKIAHDNLICCISSQEDLDWLILFKKRLWVGQDPFGTIRQKIEEKKETQKPAPHPTAHNIESHHKERQGVLSRIFHAIKKFFTR